MANRYRGPGLWGEGLTKIITRTDSNTGRRLEVPVWNGVVREARHKLDEPLGWSKPQVVFANSMADLFHKKVALRYIEAVLGVMAACPQHTFQVLTKRPERMRDILKQLTNNAASDLLAYVRAAAYARTKGYSDEHRRKKLLQTTISLDKAWPLPNIWWGASIEDRERRSRIQELRETPAAVRFLSCEPLLENLGELDLEGIDWVIIGGESGVRARPMELDWARNIVEQCRTQNVAVFVKQLGRRWSDEALSKGVKGEKMRDWPQDLQVREMPATAAL